MIKKTTERNIFRKTIYFLSHPAWNGVNCFITALAMLGFGGFVLAFIFRLFSRIQDLVSWLSEPVNISRYVTVGGSIVLMAFEPEEKNQKHHILLAIDYNLLIFG